jgi:hypothetical protein
LLYCFAFLFDEFFTNGRQASQDPGIPPADLVQTIEAIAAVKFSRMDRQWRQEERERHDQQEIWG